MSTEPHEAVRHIADLCRDLTELGARPEHVARVLRHWLHGLPLDAGRRPVEAYFSKGVRAELPTLLARWSALATLREMHPASDGATRLLLGLADGQAVEAVLLPRQGLCVSTQVGCAVGCVFCMTGRAGLLRQLGSAEIVAQVVLARAYQTVRKVVFMGMGEPSHNLEAVVEAIQILGTYGDLPYKNLVFSTVGDRRLFERLPQVGIKPALAISLHTTIAAKRARLLPRAPRIDVEDLVQLAEAYARATSYPIQYQWTLIQGVNDDVDEIEGIVHLLHGKYAVLNLIPYNTVAGLQFRRPAWSHAAEIARTLHRRGILTKLRHSAGQDVEGGCGQLRARATA